MKVIINDNSFKLDPEKKIINSIPDQYLKKGCLSGVCRVCRCKLISGNVVSSSKDIPVGSFFYPCISFAKTDIKIKAEVNSFSSGTVIDISFLSPTTLRVVLKIKNSFINSQSTILLKHPNFNEVRTYSVVNIDTNKQNNLFEIHVKLRDVGVFSEILKKTSKNDTLEYSINTPSLPSYDEIVGELNIITGGSGLGSALTRAKELISIHNIKCINLLFICRFKNDPYYLHCVDTFKKSTNIAMNLRELYFDDWINEENINAIVSQKLLTIAVGSDTILEKIKSLPFLELHSYGGVRL